MKLFTTPALALTFAAISFAQPAAPAAPTSDKKSTSKFVKGEKPTTAAPKGGPTIGSNRTKTGPADASKPAPGAATAKPGDAAASTKFVKGEKPTTATPKSGPTIGAKKTTKAPPADTKTGTNASSPAKP